MKMYPYACCDSKTSSVLYWRYKPHADSRHLAEFVKAERAWKLASSCERAAQRQLATALQSFDVELPSGRLKRRRATRTCSHLLYVDQFEGAPCLGKGACLWEDCKEHNEDECAQHPHDTLADGLSCTLKRLWESTHT
eukprot:1234897-Amphidinium_carterae.1